MKALVFADMHIFEFKQFATTTSRGLNSRLQDGLDVLGLIVDRINEPDIDFGIFAGDLWHEKNRGSIRTLYETSEVLSRLSKDVYMCAGNHDACFRVYPPPYTALGLLKRGNHHLGLNNSYWVNGGGGFTIACIPYAFDHAEQVAAINRLPDKEKTILVTHGDIVGVSYGGSHRVTAGLPRDLLEQFMFSFVGHFHHYSYLSERLLIPGAPMQHSWGDLGEDRGVWIVDITNGVATLDTFLPIRSPRFIEVNLDLDPSYSQYNTVDFFRVIASASPPTLPQNTKSIVVSTAIEAAVARSDATYMDPPETLVNRYTAIRSPERSTELAAVGKRYLPTTGEGR